MDFTTIITVGGWTIAGGLALYGVFNTQQRAREKESDQTASNLITNLRTTVDLQEKELTRLRDKETAQGKEIAHLSGQLAMLERVVQGRDPAMQAFLKDAPGLFQIARENNGLAKANSEAITALTSSITLLVEALHHNGHKE